MPDGYGKVVRINYSSTGLNTIIAQQKQYNAQLGQMGIMTTKVNAQGKVLSASWKEQTGILGRVGGQLFGAGLALMAVHRAMGFVSDAVKEGVQDFREFEYRMAEVSTILNELTLQLLPRMTEQVVSLSIAFGKATSDLAKGLYDILSAAFPAEKAIGLLNTAVRASIAGLSDVRTSVDILTTVLNTYGLSAEAGARISDDLFQSVIRGKFQFADLESALGYVVPIAAQAGIEFKELMAILSTVTRHGLHLDMTSRGLALAIQNIINPTKASADAAKRYGIEMGATALAAKGLIGWFEELNEATKVYGTQIIPEIIRNMRSMRVAMVSASDVGIAGMRADLALLLDDFGATDTALQKIVKTHQFTASQLEQVGERISRTVGEQLSVPAMIWGTMLDFLKLKLASFFTIGLDPTATMMATVTTAFADAADVFNLNAQNIAILNGNYDLLMRNLGGITSAWQELNKETLPAAIHTYDLAVAERDLALLQHSIQLETAGITTEYLAHNVALQDAVRYVAEYEKAQRSNMDAMKELNLIMRENNIEIMRLQLKGMRRRRGLTRMEERRIKRLRIENLESRIEYEENNERMSTSDFQKYTEKKNFIERELALASNRVFILKTSYDQDVENAKDYVEEIRKALITLESYWRNTYERIMDIRRQIGMRGGEVPPAPSIQFRAQAILARGPLARSRFVEEARRRGLWGLQRGSYFVPYSGMYALHRGETVTPAGGRGGTTTINIPVNISVGGIRSDLDIQSVARKMGRAIKAELVDSVSGLSKYDLR